MSYSKQGNYIPERPKFAPGEFATALAGIVSSVVKAPCEVRLFFTIRQPDGMEFTPKQATIDDLAAVRHPGHDLKYLELNARGADGEAIDLTMSLSKPSWWLAWGASSENAMRSLWSLLEERFVLQPWSYEKQTVEAKGTGGETTKTPTRPEVREYEWDVFVSHNRAQKPWVRQIVKQWRELGLRVFFDEDCITPGEHIVTGVERGLAGSRFVILVITPASVQSKWVAMEIINSVYADPDGRCGLLVPIVLEPIDFGQLRVSIRGLNMVRLDEPAERDSNYARLMDFLFGPKGAALMPPPWGGNHDETTVRPTASQTPINEKIRSDRTFENFIVGVSNQMAHAAALAVAIAPTRIYNPLFIFGSIGVGKSYLLHAIGNNVHEGKCGSVSIYVTADDFATEFSDAYQTNSLIPFRSRYRNVDFFLMDDVHLLAGHKRVQAELTYTINALADAGKQVVVSSLVAPSKIHEADPILVARLESGMVVEMRTATREERVAKLRKRAKALELPLAPRVAEFLAERIPRNAHRLEGALTRVMSYMSMNGRSEPTYSELESLLNDIIEDEVTYGES